MTADRRRWTEGGSLVRPLLLLALGVAAWSAAAIPVRATYGEQVTADEPQYLLSAISLWEDLDLDIADELEDRRWRALGNRVPLPEQTQPTEDGRRYSPHDPLLPALLAVPVGLGGWVGAKLALAGLAGALAATMTWVAVRRFDVRPRVALLAVGAFAVVPPLVAYGTQVYPELPAALLVTGAIGALTGPLGRRGLLLWLICLVALPWLAVKYAPVVVALVLCGAWRLHRHGRLGALLTSLAVLAVAGVVYLGLHQAVYGGWTVYAAGDHFVGGELDVVGTDPDYLGRSERLLGLFTDRSFGLVAWAPVFLACLPALAALVRRRTAGWDVLVLPLVAGWLTATFVALTMQGWWWPGRQVVVVVPCLVLATTWWADRLHRAGRLSSWRSLAPWAAATLFALVAWAGLLVPGYGERRTLVFDFAGTGNPLVRAWRVVLPELRSSSIETHLLTGAWWLVAAVLACWGWRSAPPDLERRPSERTSDPNGTDPGGTGRSSALGDEDAGAGEAADAHVAALDLDGGGAVG